MFVKNEKESSNVETANRSIDSQFTQNYLHLPGNGAS